MKVYINLMDVIDAILALIFVVIIVIAAAIRNGKKRKGGKP